MTEAASEVTHNRSLPPRWNELVEFSGVLHDVDAPSQRTPRMTVAMLERLGSLDNELLDTHRYYASGLVMCGIARVLRDPDAREAIGRSAGRNLFEMWRVTGSVDRPGALIPRDIRSRIISDALRETSRNAGRTLPTEVQFLSDALFVEANRRRLIARQAQREGVSPDSMEAACASGTTIGGMLDDKGIVRLDVASDATARDAASGAVTVLQITLERQSARMTALQPRGEDGELLPLTSVEIMDEAGEKALALENVGMRCAALRADEFKLGADDYIDVTPDGQTIFRKDRVVSAAQLTSPEDMGILHEKRLRCPAMFVGGLIGDVLEVITTAARHADTLASVRR